MVAINTKKLLPSSKSVSLVKISKQSSLVSLSENSKNNIEIIKSKSIEIDKLLKGTLAADKKKLNQKKREDIQKGREKEEEKLEAKPDLKKDKVDSKKAVKIGFLDWIKNFIGKTILGYFAFRLIDHMPKLIPFIKFIGNATDFVINLGGKLLDGLVTFIDWGYKAYDSTRGFVKNLFGEDGVKQFDTLSSLLNKFLNLAIIAGMATAGLGGRGKGRGGFGQKGKTRVTTGIGGKNRFRFPGTSPKVTVGGSKSLLRSVRPFLKNLKVPIIAALVDFGLSVAFGEDPGRAAFRAIGSSILGYVGAGLAGAIGLATGPGAVAAAALGSIGGGILGDMAGGALYDVFFGNKKPENKAGKYAGGGPTRGGKSPGGPKRTLRKGSYKRKTKKIPRKPGEIEITSPGSDVGGEDNLFGLFPNPLKMAQKAIDIINPFKVIENSGKNLGKSDYFGPILAITSKILLGQKPNQRDYENVGLGINLLIAKGISDGKLKGGITAAFAEGGLVDPQSISAAIDGGDITSWVASSFKEATETNAQKTLREIQNNLKLKKQEDEYKKGQETLDPNLIPGEGVTVTGGNADFWTLVAIASREDGDPQGQADVAQSIYNRVASGVYGAKTIKELITRRGQYQPTWDYPRKGRFGIPNPEWYSIKDAASAAAATGMSVSAMNSVAANLRNKKYQQEAANFVGGRTDFMGGSNQPGPGDVRRKGNEPNNFFGWFVGPAAKAYGEKNPGPATVPQLGDIVVMGGKTTPDISLGQGYGSAGSKIAGELGRFIKRRLKSPQQFQAVTEHPEHGGVLGVHAKGSYHYSGRAIDIGAYTNEQGPILATIAEFNKLKGVKPVQLLHGKNDAGHRDHVHVAYEKGGLTKPYPHIAMIGEKGREFVIDADSTKAIEKTFPGFLDAVNRAKYDEAISVLRNFASYESGSSEVVVISHENYGGEERDMSSNYGTNIISSEEYENPFDTLYMIG